MASKKPHPAKMMVELANHHIIPSMLGMIGLLVHWLSSLVKSRRRFGRLLLHDF